MKLFIPPSFAGEARNLWIRSAASGPEMDQFPPLFVCVCVCVCVCVNNRLNERHQGSSMSEWNAGSVYMFGCGNKLNDGVGKFYGR